MLIIESPVKRMILSASLYQIGWLACALLDTWMWMLYFVLFLSLHYLFVSREQKYWLFSLKVAVLGCFMDAILSYSNIFIFKSTVLPLWLIALWIMFALSIPFAFGFLRNRYILSACLGAVGAVSAYFGGISLRPDAALGAPLWFSLLIIAVSWMIFLPYCYRMLSIAETPQP